MSSVSSSSQQDTPDSAPTPIQMALPSVASTRSFTAFLLQMMTSGPQDRQLGAPPFNIYECLARFRQYLKCSDGCYTLAGVYLSRFLRTRLDISVTSYNAHRLALVSLVVAAKFNDDVYHTNSYYAHVGGVSLKSFNDMEKEFLLSLEFDLFASPEQFAKQRALQLQILSGMDVRSLAYTLHQRSTGLFNSFDDDEGFADQTCDVQSVDSPRDRYIYQQVMGGMAILATSMTPMQRSWSRNSLAAAPRTTSSVSSTKLQSLRLKQGTSSRPCKANISAMIGKPPPRILSRQSFACQ